MTKKEAVKSRILLQSADRPEIELKVACDVIEAMEFGNLRILWHHKQLRTQFLGDRLIAWACDSGLFFVTFWALIAISIKIKIGQVPFYKPAKNRLIIWYFSQGERVLIASILAARCERHCMINRLKKKTYFTHALKLKASHKYINKTVSADCIESLHSKTPSKALSFLQQRRTHTIWLSTNYRNSYKMEEVITVGAAQVHS